ncbi:hypothetical protein ACLK19_23265 [Escherichia coli]
MARCLADWRRREQYLLSSARRSFWPDSHRTWGAPDDPHAFLSSMRVPSHADFQAQQGLADKPLIDEEIGEVLATDDETQRRRCIATFSTVCMTRRFICLSAPYSMMVVSKPELGTSPTRQLPPKCVRTD